MFLFSYVCITRCVSGTWCWLTMTRCLTGSWASDRWTRWTNNNNNQGPRTISGNNFLQFVGLRIGSKQSKILDWWRGRLVVCLHLASRTYLTRTQINSLSTPNSKFSYIVITRLTCSRLAALAGGSCSSLGPPTVRSESLKPSNFLHILIIVYKMFTPAHNIIVSCWQGWAPSTYLQQLDEWEK